MHTEIRVITPEDANLILQKNTRNRPVNHSQLAIFESQLQRGEMQLTHQGIAISSTDVLLDGQHRLMAIANTGIAAQLMVTTGLPDGIFSVLDTGAKRTASDALAIDGAPHSAALAASIRLYILYHEAPGIVWTGRVPNRLVSTTYINKKYNLDKDGWTWAASAARASTINKIVTPGPMGCLMYLACVESGYSRKYIEDFSISIKSGVDLNPGNPILAYRNKMISFGTSTPQERLADFIKLFNAHTTGQQLKMFKSQQHPPMPSLVHASESIHEEACA
jgi:hypothetical protein